MKDIILQLKAAITSPKLVRLNVRRKYIWSDFVESRSSGKVSPTDNVKIVFIGECAIDDGDPRREFFSGITTKQGRRKIKKVRGALRSLKAQVLLGGPGTRPPEFFSIFSMLKHVFLHF